MNRHYISVMIDTPDAAPMTQKQAEHFVLNAIRTVRDNHAKRPQANFISGPAARAIAGSVMYVSKQSFPKERPADVWDGERLTREGGPLQERIRQKLIKEGGLSSSRAGDITNELLHLFMTSNLCTPGARKFYESLNDA